LSLSILLGFNILAYRISLSFYNKEIKGYSYIFSIFPISLIFLYLFIPFKIFIYKLRLGLIVQFLKSFFPFTKNLSFKEYISCDVVCTIIYPIISLALAICMFTCKECRLNEERNDCKRQNVIGIVIQVVPYFARAMQCVNRLIFVKNKRVLYSINIIKYLSKIGFVFIAYLTKTSI
jgi:hypothetical protein